MSKLKVGDKVRLYDCSYSYLVTDGKLINRWGGGDRSNGDYEIIAIGCLLPTNREPIAICRDVPDNNTIIKRLPDNAIIFTQARFLRKRMKKVKVEVRPFKSRQIGQRIILEDNPQALKCSGFDSTRYCGPLQTIEVEVEDD